MLNLFWSTEDSEAVHKHSFKQAAAEVAPWHRACLSAALSVLFSLPLSADSKDGLCEARGRRGQRTKRLQDVGTQRQETQWGTARKQKGRAAGGPQRR